MLRVARVRTKCLVWVSKGWKAKNQGHSSGRGVVSPCFFCIMRGAPGSASASARGRSLPFMLPRHDSIEICKIGCLAVPQLCLIMLPESIHRCVSTGTSSVSSCFPCSSAAVHHHLTQPGRPIALRNDFIALPEHRWPAGKRGKAGSRRCKQVLGRCPAGWHSPEDPP